MRNTVYLLHFDRPISPNHSCRHYLGWTMNLPKRLEAHRKGQGARLCEVAMERGIGFDLARVWAGTRRLERRLKNRKNGPKLCPICLSQTQALDFTLDDVQELTF